MRTAIAALLLLGVAACDRGTAADEAAAPAAADAGLAQWRADVLRGCIGGGRDAAGPGVPVERHCACAVDRVMAGRTLAQLEAAERSGEHEQRFTALLRQCIREISPDYRPGH
jgi:hypothetical protein